MWNVTTMRLPLFRIGKLTRFDPFILLPAFALVLLGGLWLAVWHQLNEERQLARHATLAKSQALAHTFAETSLRILQQVDHAALLFKIRYEESGGKLTIDNFLRKNGAYNPELPTDTALRLMLIDASGRQIESNLPFDSASVADMPWFRELANRPDNGVVISKPFDPLKLDADEGDKTSKPWLIRLSRRLVLADGKFAGVLLVELDPGQFVDHFDSSDLGAQGVVLLTSPVENLSLRRIGEEMQASNTLVFSEQPGAQDRDDRSASLIKQHSSTSDSMNANIEQRYLQTPFDNVRRLYSARSLAEFGLVGLVGLTEDQALVQYQRHKIRYRLVAAVITLLILGFIAILMRQSQHLQLALRQIRTSEARLHTIADTIPAMVAYIDAEQRHRFHNAAYGRSLGPNSEQVLGKTVREVVGEARYQFFLPYILRVLSGEALVYEQESETDGVYRCLESHYIPQFDIDSGEVVGFHVMRQDITSKKLEQLRLQQLAQVDALTGLCNRAGFQLRLQDAMQRSRNQHGLLALLYLDIDHFKPVNDTHGHKVGDSLLQAFAQRLSRVFRSSDTVARLGGDEFTVIMENLHSREDAINLAAKVVLAMQPEFELLAAGGAIEVGVTVRVSSSVGLAFYQGEEQSAEQLIHEADMMLYQAKRGGRNRYVVSEA
ncbi:MAG: hypothetical protein RL748_3648 [Pseudomonadota bacterium]